MLCANKICVGYATQRSGLCLSCELRYNTTPPKFERRLQALLNERDPNPMELNIFFAEEKRRKEPHGDQS